MKLARWIVEDAGILYYYCPECKVVHPIPKNGWTFSGTEECPTFVPSFGQHASKGYCHCTITDGKMKFYPDSYHGRSDTIDLPDLPPELLIEKDGLVGITSDAIFERNPK